VPSRSSSPSAGLDPASGFAPHVLRDYALVADGHRGAVYGPRGDIAWLCAPGWDDESVLSGLIGGGGTYTITPPDRYVWGGHYEDGSLIWRNRWIGCSQTVECREALAMPSTPRTAVLLRQVVAVDGDATVSVHLQLVGDHGLGDPDGITRVAPGVFTGLTGGVHWRWSGARGVRSATHRADGLHLTLEVPSGTRHDLVLEVGRDPFDDVPLPDPTALWRSTETAWSEAVPLLEGGVARRDARHAYAVLLGLTTPDGAMVAAATTSLPEHADGGRAYDYRYVWLRDQAYACLALAAAGGGELFDRQLSWLVTRVREHAGEGGHLAPVYRTDGSPVPEEVELDLPGYPGGRTVVGNRAGGQHQLDSYGDLLLLMATARERGWLGAEGVEAAQLLVRGVERLWDVDDAGLWELEDRWWTQSRLACVAGLRAWAKVAATSEAGALMALAEKIMAETSARCTAPGGWWRRSPDHDGTDASLVAAAVRGAVPVDDPRTTATLDEVRRSLTEDGYVYRFAHDDGPLGDHEGAFLLCGFLVALAEHQQGTPASLLAAARAFERTRSAAGAPGLFAEEFDVTQRQLLGNLPQAFVHALLIETAVTLGRDLPAEGTR
jgi:hypothetical protein